MSLIRFSGCNSFFEVYVYDFSVIEKQTFTLSHCLTVVMIVWFSGIQESVISVIFLCLIS